MTFNHKSITDPLYGYVGLSEVEAAIVSSPSFQRLHNVRQLGLAHLVFPSAGYSRFAHSIGACHNAGRIIDAIGQNAPNVSIPPKRKQIYRLAALLHDIGHYPFSHATEHAIQSYYVGASVLDFGDSAGNGNGEGVGLSHEDVGRVIIESDPDLQKAFEKHSIDVSELLHVFSKNDPDALFGIISSDLDCDRLDYLKRTAHMCGVPYGEVDTDFIISKSTVDKDGILCFQSKASTAIDHFLVSRFYDYMQVVYHKTVVGLEWSLNFLIVELLNRGDLNVSENDVKELVKYRRWAELDDNHIYAKFKELHANLSDAAGAQIACDHLRAVLYRKPAKLVYSWEGLLPKDDAQAKLRLALVRNNVSAIARSMGIDPRRFEVIDRKPFPFSSNLSKPNGELTYGEQARSVSILDKGKRKSHLLSERQDTLISTLSGTRNFSIKVLYLPRDSEEKSVRDEVRKKFNSLD